MNRRDALRRIALPAVGAGLLNLQTELLAETVPEALDSKVLRMDGFYMKRIQHVLSTTESILKGAYHGWGLALHQLVEESGQPLPTLPVRTHPSWPHLHCLCHCTVVASLDEDQREQMSVYGGVGDELHQAFWANLYPTVIYPLMYLDVAARAGRTGEDGAEANASDMVVLVNYLFGDRLTRKRSLVLAGLRSRVNRDHMVKFRKTLAPCIDAVESAWQRSDFVDNAIGRAGGCQCPRDLPPGERVKWCRKWCNKQGVGSDVAEGPGTKRPWGPYHPISPGPVPTLHETLHGELKPVDKNDVAMLKPHPLYSPLEELVVPDLRGFRIVAN